MLSGNIVLTFLIQTFIVSSEYLPNYDISITGSYEQDGILYVGEKLKFLCFLEDSQNYNDKNLSWDVSNTNYYISNTSDYNSISSFFYIDNITRQFEKQYECTIHDGSRKVLISESLHLTEPPTYYLKVEPISKLKQNFSEYEYIEINANSSGFPTPIKRFWIWTPYLPINTEKTYNKMRRDYTLNFIDLWDHNEIIEKNAYIYGTNKTIDNELNNNNEERKYQYLGFADEEYSEYEYDQTDYRKQAFTWNVTYSDNNKTGVKDTHTLYGNLIKSGNYTFVAENQYAKKNVTFQIYIEGLQIIRLNDSYIKWGQDGQISCNAYSYPKINKFVWSIVPCSWTSKPRYECLDKSQNYFQLKFSSKPKTIGPLHYSSLLNFTNTNDLIRLSNFSFGLIKCSGFNEIVNKTVATQLYVGELEKPKTIFSNNVQIDNAIKNNTIFNIEYVKTFNVTCEGLKSKYRDIIKWCKKLNKTSHKCLGINSKDLNIEIFYNSTDTTYQTTLMFLHLQKENNGLYQCVFRTILNNRVEVFPVFEININELHPWLHHLTSGIILVLLIVVAILTYYCYRYFQMRKRLKELGLENFANGKPDSINPEIAISEQAELLPYNKTYEIPKKRIQLGKILGQGAFGSVYMASINAKHNNEVFCWNIKEIQAPKIVAVKMLKQNADTKTLHALGRELKILQHIGKHSYVISLLGAVTKTIHECELMLIIEYCKHGSLDNFLVNNRDSFVDQIIQKTDQIILKQIDRSVLIENSIDYDEDENTHNEKLLMKYEKKENEKKRYSENLYITTMRRKQIKNMKFNTTDLVIWSQQISCGMNHLSSLNIVHGDLAARNILLSDNFAVKISDFGLAKQIYENEQYKKLEKKQLLPIKWYAIEAIEDRKLTSKSDVWSYGVVLWELFSLGKMPYSDIEHMDYSFLHKLKKGYRLDQPCYGNRTIYNNMLSCWKNNPLGRPNFDDLSKMFKKYQAEKIVPNYNNLHVYDNTTYLENLQNEEHPISFSNNSYEIHPIYEEIDLPTAANTAQYLNSPIAGGMPKLNNTLGSSTEYQNINSAKSQQTNFNSSSLYENLNPSHATLNLGVIKNPMKGNLVNKLNIILDERKSLQNVENFRQYQNN